MLSNSPAARSPAVNRVTIGAHRLVRDRSVTVAALIGAARVSKRFPDTLATSETVYLVVQHDIQQ
jgi:hypothetical protein